MQNCIVLNFLLILLFIAGCISAQTLGDGVYCIQAVHSGKILDLDDSQSYNNGQNIHQWDWHGHDNQKWRIIHVADGYYKVQSYKVDRYMEVGGRVDRNGDNIQVWDWCDSDNRLWKIEHLGNNEYRIVNKQSGKVLDVSGNSYNNGANVQQWDWHGGNNQRWHFARIDINPQIWMSCLPDYLKLSKMLIPGTHDTIATKDPMKAIGLSGDITGTTVCQTMSLTNQLNCGIRFIDIRGRHYQNRLPIHHGPVYQDQDFQQVVTDCLNFLNAYPSECIVMSLKDEYDSVGCSRSYEDTVKEYIQNNSPNRWYIQNTIPTLQEVRGKIVLVRRFSGSLGYTWDQANIQDDYSVPNATIEIGPIEVDKLEPDISWKWNRVRDKFDSAKNNPTDTQYYISFASGTWRTIPNIRVISGPINTRVREYFTATTDYYHKNPASQWGCLIPMDFPEYNGILAIILANHCVR